MKKLLSLSTALLLITTCFSTCVFATNIFDRQKEGLNEATQPPKQIAVRDYTILHNKKVNHILEDLEDVEEYLKEDVFAVNQKLVVTNNQTIPLILGAVLQYKQNNEYHQYLIANTGLLSKATQPNAVKRAHQNGFHLIQAIPGHVSLQLLAWLQVSANYTVIALYTNRPVCRHCYLIASSLWKKELPTNEKGCLSMPFPLLDKMPNLAQQYINTHLSLSFVQSVVVPMMGYVSKEKMEKAIQQKDNQLDEKDEQIQMLNQEINKKDKQLNKKNNRINSLANELKEKKQILGALQKNEEKKEAKLPLDENTKQKLFDAIEHNNVEKVKEFLENYEDVVSATKGSNKITPFLWAVLHRSFDIVKLLRENGADINAKDKNGKNALYYACLQKRV